ncbi:MAG: hypothetical protein V1676_00905 [Candidatus Diapherotrites archaeon]
MNSHESGEKVIKESVQRTQPEGFDTITMDIAQIREQSKDPFFISMLLYKVAKEREETNRLLGSINEKYDRIMFELKTGEMDKTALFPSKETEFETLPEQDQLIVKYIGQKGSANAKDIQEVMHYKGLNAASQRLNKLYKEGYLKKVQSGKQVMYLVRG